MPEISESSFSATVTVKHATSADSAKKPLIMMFAEVAKGVVKDALADNMSTIAAVFNFLTAKGAQGN